MKKLYLLIITMAFIILPFYSCFDDPGGSTDYKVRTYEVNFDDRNYILKSGYTNSTGIYFVFANPNFWLEGANVKGIGTVVHADSESIDIDIYGGTSFPHYLTYEKDKGYLIQATIGNTDHSINYEKWYYLYFFEQNGKLYYSYQQIKGYDNTRN